MNSRASLTVAGPALAAQASTGFVACMVVVAAPSGKHSVLVNGTVWPAIG